VKIVTLCDMSEQLGGEGRPGSHDQFMLGQKSLETTMRTSALPNLDSLTEVGDYRQTASAA